MAKKKKARKVAKKKNLCRRRRNVSSNRSRGRVLIGELAEALTYRGGQGKARLSRWRHIFESGVQVLGQPDGSVLLKSKSGKRLWDWFERK